MSMVIRFLWPERSPANFPPITPAAGPDSTVVTGLAMADWLDEMPPRDCMIWRSTAIPIWRRAWPSAVR